MFFPKETMQNYEQSFGTWYTWSIHDNNSAFKTIFISKRAAL